MKKQNYFITGTDTDVGKTVIAAGLLLKARQQGLSTIGLKPVAAGCEKTSSGLRNSDALLLQSVMTEQLTYEEINPIALETAIAPHIAAKLEKRNITADRLAGFCRAHLSAAEFVVVEGAGGWRVPLNSRDTVANLVQLLRLPVILVVGIKLGCINHALLTQEAILKDGLMLAGWVANCVDRDMLACDENIQDLRERLQAPCFGVVPWLENPTPENVSHYLSLMS
jgi:dethiobiotin synthetase